MLESFFTRGLFYYNLSDLPSSCDTRYGVHAYMDTHGLAARLGSAWRLGLPARLGLAAQLGGSARLGGWARLSGSAWLGGDVEISRMRMCPLDVIVHSI